MTENEAVLEQLIVEKEHELERIRFQLSTERDGAKTVRSARRNMVRWIERIMNEMAMATVIEKTHSERNKEMRNWIRELKTMIDTDIAVMARDMDDMPF